jgi:predicted phosphoribosyltransferase
MRSAAGSLARSAVDSSAIARGTRGGDGGPRVIVVDDGVATGATMRAALDAVRMAGAAEVVAAVPVGSVDGLDTLRAVADAWCA